MFPMSEVPSYLCTRISVILTAAKPRLREPILMTKNTVCFAVRQQ
jgi:hypothetical protein